jgi:hypothetical protein
MPNHDHTNHDGPLPAQSIHFAVPPARTLTWRLAANSTLRVFDARVWVTRIHSPYDHWVQPGETLRLARGERIWLSTDADVSARVTLTSAWRPPFTPLQWMAERFEACMTLLALRRAR